MWRTLQRKLTGVYGATMATRLVDEIRGNVADEVGWVLVEGTDKPIQLMLDDAIEDAMKRMENDIHGMVESSLTQHHEGHSVMTTVAEEPVFPDGDYEEEAADLNS